MEDSNNARKIVLEYIQEDYEEKEVITTNIMKLLWDKNSNFLVRVKKDGNILCKFTGSAVAQQFPNVERVRIAEKVYSGLLIEFIYFDPETVSDKVLFRFYAPYYDFITVYPVNKNMYATLE